MMLRVLAGFGFALGWLPVFLFRVEEQGASLPFYTPAERLWVRLTPVILTVHVSTACSLLTFAADPSPLRIAGGALIFASGFAFWFWGRFLIGPLRRRRLPDEPPHQFRQDGAFGLVRHPLYFSVLVMAAAPLVASGSAIPLATYAFCVVAIAVRARQEERWLRAQLGPAYEQYSRRVKRLVPFLW